MPTVPGRTAGVYDLLGVERTPGEKPSAGRGASVYELLDMPHAPVSQETQDGAAKVPVGPSMESLFAQFREDHPRRFKARVRGFAEYDPDDIGAQHRVSKLTGKPIAPKPSTNGQAERLTAIESLSSEQINADRKGSPAYYRRVMKDPAFAAMVIDDLEHTAGLERIWPTIKAMIPDLPLWVKANLPIPLSRKDQEALPGLGRDIGRRYKSGQVQFSQGYLGNQLLQRAKETGEYDEGILDTLKGLDEELQGLESSEDRGFIGGIPEAMAEQATNLAGGLAARGVGLLGGPAGVGAAGFAHGAATESGHAMVQFARMTDNEGNRVEPRMAADFAIVAGAMNGALEIVGGGTLLRALPGNSALKKKLSTGAVRIGLSKILANRARAQAFWKVIEPHVTAVVTEGSTEAAQELVAIVAGELAKDSSFEGYDMEVLSRENLARVAEAGAAGLQMGLGFGVAGTAQRATARPSLAAGAAQPAAPEGQGQDRNTEAQSPQSGTGGVTISEQESAQGVAGQGIATDKTADISGEIAPPEGGTPNVEVGEDLQAAASAFAQEVDAVQVAQRDALFLEKLQEWASKGLLTQRSPELTAEYVQEVADRAVGEGLDTVRVSASTVREMVEGKPDVAQELRRAVPDFDRQMSQAEAVGGDLLIGLGNYAAYVAPGKSGKALQPFLKLRPGGLTAEEMQEAGPAIEQQMRGLLEQQQQEGAREQEAEDLYTELVQERAAELKGVGNRAVQKQAEVGAALEVAMVRNLAKRAGLGVREAWEKFRARLSSAPADAEAAAAQLDQAVEEEGPSFGQGRPVLKRGFTVRYKTRLTKMDFDRGELVGSNELLPDQEQIKESTEAFDTIEEAEAKADEIRDLYMGQVDVSIEEGVGLKSIYYRQPLARFNQVVEEPTRAGDIERANQIIGEMPAEELAHYLDSFKGGRLGTLARTWLEAKTGKRDIEDVADAPAAESAPQNAEQASLFGVAANDADVGYSGLDDAAPGQTGMLFQDADEPERTIAGEYGEATVVTIEGVEPYPARYKVVEVTDLVPSHDFTSGSGRPNEAFPKSLQPRNLNDNQSQVGRILNMGRNWQPGDANSPSEFAQTGPPTVSPEGYVINGNGRVGAAQLAAAEGNFEKNKEFLMRASALYGLDPVAISNMTNPMLVREMAFSGKSAEAMRFAAQGNVSLTGSESPVREAHRLNRTIGADLLRLIDPEAGTIREAVNEGQYNRELVTLLQNNLPPAERAKYIEQNKLNESGVQLLEDMLLTQFVPVEIVERLRAPGGKKQILNTIETAIPVLQRIVQQTHETPGSTPTDLRPALLGALDFLSRNPDAKSYLAAANLDLFSGATPQEIEMVVDALLTSGDQPKVFRERLAAFGTDLEAGLGLDPKQAAEAFAERFGVAQREGAEFAAQEGAFSSHFDSMIPEEATVQAGIETGVTAEAAEGQRALTKARPRQIRGSYSPELNAVALTPKANVSTFVHELGHWYLFALNDVAQGSDGKQGNDGLEGARADVAAVLEWVGADSVEGMSTAQHEQFANGFLAYLKDGKIPEGAGAQVARALRNFRNWLMGLWKSGKLQAIDGIALSDEVRGVFDRMLATDAAVDEARHATGARALYVGRDDLNLTEAERAKYIEDAQEIVDDARQTMDENTLRAAARRETKDYRERVAQQMKAVRKEFERRREWRARKYLTAENAEKRGEGQGQGEGEGQTHRLDHAAVVEILSRDEAGKALLKKMPFGQHAMTTKTGGLDPDEVAVRFGYASGEQMLREVIPLTETEVKRRIKEEAENRVDDELPLPPKEKLDEDAMVAVANRKLENVILAEDAALSRELGDAPMDTKRMRAIAKGAIAEMPVGSIRPAQHVREMQYQQRKALKGVQTGNSAMVREARRRQLMQKYLFDEAMEAQRTINKILKNTARYRRATLRKRLAIAGSSQVGASSYIDQIDAILNRMQLSQATPPQGIESLAQFLDREEANGKPVRVDEDVVGRSVPWRSLDLFQFQAIDDALKNIEKMGKLEGELRLGARQESVEQARITTRDTLQANLERTDVTVVGKEAVGRKVRDRMLAFHTRLRRMSNIWRVADGFNDNGALWALWKQPADEAASRKFALQREAHEKLRTIWKNYGARKLRQKVQIPKTEFALSKQEVFALALNWGNLQNRMRVLELGEAAPGVDAYTIDAILDTLSTEDMETVQATWDLLDEYWPLIQKNEVETTGVHPKRVEPVKVRHKGVEYRGGYYPIRYDSDATGKTMEYTTNEQLAGALKDMGNLARAQTRQGHTEARVGSGGQKLRLDLNVIPEHLNNVIHDVTHRSVVMSYVRLLRDGQTDQALREYLPGGPATVAEIRRWVGRLAGSDRVPTEVEDRVLGHLRRGTVASRIGLKLTVIGQQVFGLGNTAARVGAVYTAGAIGDLLGDFATGQLGNKYTAIMQASEFMRSRSETYSRDAAEAMLQLSKNRVLRGLDIAMFGAIGKMQLAVDIPTWLAGYNKAVDENPEIAHEDAVAVADRLVRESQGSGLRTDLSAIEDTNNEWKRTFTSLYSYFNVVYNLMTDNAARVQQQRDPAAVGKALGDYLWIVGLQATLANLAVGRGPDDEEGWWEWALKNQLTFMAGTIPYLRDIVSGIEYGKAEAAGSPFGDLAKLGMQVKQGEADRPLLHSAVNVAGILGHLPAGQFNTFLRGLEDIQDGKTSGLEAAVNLAVPLQRVDNRAGAAESGLTVE
jgi:hypothetical protein